MVKEKKGKYIEVGRDTWTKGTSKTEQAALRKQQHNYSGSRREIKKHKYEGVRTEIIKLNFTIDALKSSLNAFTKTEEKVASSI